MKQSLLMFTIVGLLLAGCDNSKTYTINGTLNNVNGEKALLIQVEDGKYDTLANASIADQKFTLKGKIDQLTVAFLVIEGMRVNPPQVFLEPGTFTATVDNQGIKVEGGAAQTLQNQFKDIDNESNQKAMELNGAYMQAYQAGDSDKMDSIRSAFNDMQHEASEKTDALIKANNNSVVAAFHALNQSYQKNLEELKPLYASLGEEAKNSTYGKDFQARIAALEAVEIGKIAPNFTLDTPEGGKITLHEIPGKLKLIDFWASWCGPCRSENPHVVEVYKEYSEKGLEIFGVSLDDNKDAWLQAIEDDNLIWKHGSDLKGWQSEPAKMYAVSGIPHTVLLDAENRIIAKDLRGEALKNKIAELLD